ncbi:MAG: hypothetical protein H6702_04650 [Myxococcales bacterium]|nr:hypothetical protein [Myxococcales bacterium]
MRAFVLTLLGALALTLACGESPRDDYQAWRGRTRSYRGDGGAGPANPDGGTYSELADLRGRWLLNSLLFGGIEVGLRVVFEAAEGETNDPPRELVARIWLWDMPDDSAPLVTTTGSLDDKGRFQLVADPLDLPGSIINRDDPVQAVVILNARTLGAGTWCGVAEGSVQRPLTLPLEGSTFAALRDDDDEARLDLSDVPFRCPDDPEPPAPDMGVESDAGPVERPAAPDLSGVGSAYADLTGDWLFTADFDIPLQLWISLRAIPGAEGGSLDGALRSVRAAPGEPALATFTTQVEADGRFEIWLPDFTLSVGNLAIEADILLAAATTGDGFCGAAAGAIRSPAVFAQTLDGVTYRAIPWVPGESTAGAPNACPE